MSRPSIKMFKIEMRITEDEYKALEYARHYILLKAKLSSSASVLRLILLNAKPAGEIT